MRNAKKIIVICILFLLFIKCDHSNQPSNIPWSHLSVENKPGVYWWWMGSAVDKYNLRYNLKSLQEAGVGTVHIIPIYGVTGKEEKYIDFLSPLWMEMLEFTVEEAERLGMRVDMSTTTGWPFGGAHVKPENAASRLDWNVQNLFGGELFDCSIKDSNFLTCMAYSSKGEIINLGEKADKDGTINWIAPEGEWSIYILSLEGTGQKVKRAAPGNIGLVLDPFSKNALTKYLDRYDNSFRNYQNMEIRAQYHDSYEYYRADWTKSFFHTFVSRNGYDLKKNLPQLLNPEKRNPGVLADYRRTIAGLHLEYIELWNEWSHSYGWITRNEAHGAPANLLDLYAAADIPETETFGSRKFNIPGIRYLSENNSKSEPPNPLLLKFASSAANVTGKTLVASESCTWLRDHYKSALSHVKPQIDELFLSGINHIFYHGNAYSPKEAEWPGWIFYASTHFEIENSIWKDFDELNKYVARCQSVLQSALPDNDILLYWPVEDLYHAYSDALLRQFTVHHIDWFSDSEFGKLADTLYSRGFTFDYISDKQLGDLIDGNGIIYSGANEYKALVIPKTKYMPINTLNKIKSIIESGAKVIFQKSLPEQLPGYSNHFEKKEKFRKNLSELTLLKSNGPNKQNFLISNDINSALKEIGLIPEMLRDYGLSFIRKKHGTGNYYFISNLNSETVDSWIPFSVELGSALIYDPKYHNRTGTVSVKQNNNSPEIYLQMQPGESYIVKTFNEKNVRSNNWQYFSQPIDTINLEGNWKIEFIEGGPELPESINTDTLKNWTEWEDSLLTKFSGTAKYTLSFILSDIGYDEVFLDLGKVCESAEVIVNGKRVGNLWSFPFNILVKDFLQVGMNKLEVNITNLSANRIRDLDLRKINWKKFFFVNVFYEDFDASNWELMESGLIGPVNLYPVNFLELSSNLK